MILYTFGSLLGILLSGQFYVNKIPVEAGSGSLPFLFQTFFSCLARELSRCAFMFSSNFYFIVEKGSFVCYFGLGDSEA